MEGDGVPELFAMRPDRIEVYDGRSHLLKWARTPEAGREYRTVCGFYDIDGDGVREAWVDADEPANQDRVLLAYDWTAPPGDPPEVEFYTTGSQFISFFDLDADGKLEFIIVDFEFGDWYTFVGGDGTAAAIDSPPLEPSSGDALRGGSRGYPNPFRPFTTIEFDLAEPAVVNLRIIGAGGELIRNLLDNAPLGSGPHSIRWDSRDERGRHVSSGQYFYTLKAGDRQDTGRIVHLR